MTDCIFCKIVAGEIPSFKVYEDENHLAFLDINPNTRGQTVLVTKKHYSSYTFELSEDVYARLMRAAKEVARRLDEKLGVRRTVLVAEGMGVDHAHLKLYPLHGIEAREFGEVPERVYFDKYPGFVTTKIGPEADSGELEKLAAKISE